MNDGEGPGHYWGPDDEAWITDRRSEADDIVNALKGVGHSLFVGLDYPPQNYRKHETVKCTATGRKNFR